MDKISIKLFLTFFLIFSVFSFSAFWLENTRLDLTRAIVDEGRFEIDSYFNNTGDRIKNNGHYYIDSMPGLSFITVPVYLPYRLLFGKVSYRNDLYKQNENLDYWILIFLVISLVSSIFSALNVVLVYKISKYFLERKINRLFLAFIFGLGTYTIHAGRQFNGAAVSTFFIFLSFYLIFMFKKENKDRFFLSGLFSGAAIITEIHTFFIAIFLFIIVLLTKDKKFILKFLIGISLVLSVLLFYNFKVFGTVTFLGIRKVDETIWPYSCKTTDNYDGCNFYKEAFKSGDINICNKIKDNKISSRCKAVVTGNIKFCEDSDTKTYCVIRVYLSKLGNGVHYPIVYFSNFNIKIWVRMLFYPFKGLFFFSPILLLSMIGLIYMYRNYKLETVMIIISLIAILQFQASKSLWYNGIDLVIRQFNVLIPFLMLPLTYISKKKLLWYLLLFFGLISIMMGIITLQPHHPDPYFIVKPTVHISDEFYKISKTWKPLGNPLFEYYLPRFFEKGPKSSVLERIFKTEFPPFLNILILLLILLFIWRKELNFR